MIALRDTLTCKFVNVALQLNQLYLTRVIQLSNL